MFYSLLYIQKIELSTIIDKYKIDNSILENDNERMDYEINKANDFEGQIATLIREVNFIFYFIILIFLDKCVEDKTVRSRI